MPNLMNARVEKIEFILTQAFSPTALHIDDESWKHAGHAGAKESGGGHFAVHITSESFSGKSRMACHRMINHALKDEFGPTIHALSIDAKAA